ncbi:TATA-binding protein-associated factor [Nematocida sp. AWRm80]|nr:TATA-binding protein-associated factor [Nematocida sp. AWRm80]
MSNISKLFKGIREAQSIGVKKHIAHEILSTYCTVVGLLESMLSEIAGLAESLNWENRVIASQIIEELLRLGTISDRFLPLEECIKINLPEILKGNKYLAAEYKEEKVKEGKQFIDLEDHNVVLSLSNLSIPGVTKREENIMKRKKSTQTVQVKELVEINDFSSFCKLIIGNLTSFDWHKRHGASQVLLGVFRGISRRDSDTLTVATLSAEEFLLPLVRVLVMDRFNDYEMDVAISPVRETVSLAIKELIPFLNQPTFVSLLETLTSLGKHDDWQVRYSGLIGIKSITPMIDKNNQATRQSLKSICNTSIELLTDIDEDVKGIAAAILIQILDKYTNKETEEIQALVDIEEVLSLCWEVLEEEEDLTAAKAKIIHLIEKIQSLSFEIAEIDKEKYLSILKSIRMPIEIVRQAVHSLLRSIEVILPYDALSAVLFSILMETEGMLREDLKLTLRHIAQHLKDPARTQEIISAFVQVIFMAPYTGSNLSNAKALIVIGETDICATDDGCKAAGEERVLQGRVSLFEAIEDTPILLPYLHKHFSEDISSNYSNSQYYTLFKCLYTARRLLSSDKDTKLCIKSILSTLVDTDQKVLSEASENRTDLTRGAYSILKYALKREDPEDKERIVYLFNLQTPLPVLRLISETIFQAPERFESLLQLAIQCVIATETPEDKDDKEEKEDKPSTQKDKKDKKDQKPQKDREVKRPKLMEELEIEEEPWRMLTLFEVAGDKFLHTKAFAGLKTDFLNCALFLKHTINCFKEISQLSFIFSYAFTNRHSEIVGYIISKDQEYCNEYIKQVRKELASLPVLLDGTEHLLFLEFLEKTILSSEMNLRIGILSLLVTVMNTPFKEDQCRKLASKTFSSVVPSMYLRGPLNTDDKEIQSIVETEREKIDNLGKTEDITGIETRVVLREYQKKGIEWMCFLKKTGLSGMLCDDMGLGKTIQVLSLLTLLQKQMPSEEFKVLVLCPSALTGHWHSEISANFPTLFSAPIHKYSGSGICIASYDKYRLNSEQYTKYSWFYLVMDEGHIIRNANTLLHTRIKSLNAQYKILLTGTPIQNNIGELWALFDILMPGYLGTEKEFSRQYIKPIQRGREGKGTQSDIEIAKQRIEELHQIVLPFMLRRMKEAVLSDLPPKVLTDVCVNMDPMQKRIYEAIEQEDICSGEYGKVNASSNNFSYLNKLIKACSHPKLLSPEEMPLQLTLKEKKELSSGKIQALLDLLKASLHSSKILIFCQYKGTIDILSKEVEQALPEIRWCKMDGSIKGEHRADLAKKFNNDPDMSIMYLSTHVGGLGLNLTGADVVIFFEHDWNPMMDMQAMDRAHRIGQQKLVSVFRLVTKGTIEENIMSLQKFKTYIASTVVNQQNVEIETMDTQNILERLSKEKAPAQPITREEEYGDFV